MHTQSIFKALILLLLSLLLFRCANPVTPEGGPKDITPPEVVESEPPNYSTNFSLPSIKITFNEFVNLKSSGSEIFISPPLSTKPDYKLRGKTIIVDFEDSLMSKTTYIINFGRSISDLTEGNILENFRYVLSTGDYIDSLMISGEVIDAFDNKPVPDVFAQLYVDSNDTIPFDSLPYLVPPLYITQTNEQGRFVFQNLRNDSYKLFVLGDKSGEFIYNMPDEKIAFSDSLIHPWRAPFSSSDTTSQDSIPITDTLVPAALTLRLFDEVDSTQEIKEAELLMNNLFRITFKFSPRNPVIVPLNIDTVPAWCMEEFSPNLDTVLLFTTVEIPDTLILEVRDGSDVLDTLFIEPTQIVKKKRSKKKDEEEKPIQLTIAWHPRGTFIYQKSSLTGTLSYPVSEYDFSGIKLISEGDTITPSVGFTDPLMRRFDVASAWKEATSYKLLIPDSAFISYNQLSQDTVIHSFQTFNPRDYGNLLINLKIDDNPGSYIIQLLTDKGKVVEERFANESGQIKFALIVPAKYTIKAILDANLNQQWDTGDYLNRIQPELVFFFPKIIEIRGNWDVEEEWKL